MCGVIICGAIYGLQVILLQRDLVKINSHDWLIRYSFLYSNKSLHQYCLVFCSFPWSYSAMPPYSENQENEDPNNHHSPKNLLDQDEELKHTRKAAKKAKRDKKALQEVSVYSNIVH